MKRKSAPRFLRYSFLAVSRFPGYSPTATVQNIPVS